MALIACSECGGEVSSKAPTCPRCGAPVGKPARTDSKAQRILAGGVLLIIGIIFYAASSPSDSSKSEAPKKDEKTEAECRKDLHCYGQRFFTNAGVYCVAPIEKLAKYEVKWTDGLLESKFSKVGWLNKEDGTLTYYGDKARFQNGFGAFQNVAYECDLNPEGNKVLAVRVNPKD